MNKSVKLLLILVLLLAVSFAIWISNEDDVLEVSDVLEFRIDTVLTKQQDTCLRISGICGQSAKFIERVNIMKNAESIEIKIPIVFVGFHKNENLSGNFCEIVLIKPSTTKVVFGNLRKTIWER